MFKESLVVISGTRSRAGIVIYIYSSFNHACCNFTWVNELSSFLAPVMKIMVMSLMAGTNTGYDREMTTNERRFHLDISR